MKVATKFALAFVASGLLSVVVYSSVAASREVDHIEETVAEDLASLGRTLSASVMTVWERDGEARALELVAVHDSDEAIDVRWTWLDVDGAHAFSPRGGVSVVPSLLRGEQRTWVGVTAAGKRRVYAYVPLLRPGMRPAALEFSRPLVKESQVFWAEIREQLLLSTIVAAFAASVALLLTTMIVSRPLARVAEQARRIGRGDLSHKLPERGSDEVSELVQELNAMCDALKEARTRASDETEKRLAALEQLRHADRLRTVGTLASGIAHELGTPLNVISMRAKMIVTGEVPAASAPESAKIIASQTERVTKIVRQLLDFARRRTPKRTDTDLADLADRTKLLLAALAKKSGVDVQVEPGPKVRLNVDAAQIEQALTNLVINGIHAMPRGGPLTIAVREDEVAAATSPERPQRCAVVEVIDTGIGIAPEYLDRIFEPFFTTKGVGEGTGLGLSVTHGIVEDHGGWMTAKSSPGKGTRFTVYLPVEPDGATTPTTRGGAVVQPPPPAGEAGDRADS
jgi:signal transduction histidine kinase